MTTVHDTLLVTGPVNAVPLLTTPTTGTTVTLTPTQPHTDVLLLHASTIAALTITTTNAVNDGQTLSIYFNSAVTTCTWSGANWLGTVALAVPGAPTAGQRVSFVYSVARSGWIRVA